MGYKVGERVECIDAAGSPDSKVGEFYYVLTVHEIGHGGDTLLILSLERGGKQHCSVLDHRVKPAPENTVLFEEGQAVRVKNAEGAGKFLKAGAIYHLAQQCLREDAYLKLAEQPGTDYWPSRFEPAPPKMKYEFAAGQLLKCINGAVGKVNDHEAFKDEIYRCDEAVSTSEDYKCISVTHVATGRTCAGAFVSRFEPTAPAKTTLLFKKGQLLMCKDGSKPPVRTSALVTGEIYTCDENVYEGNTHCINVTHMATGTKTGGFAYRFEPYTDKCSIGCHRENYNRFGCAKEDCVTPAHWPDREPRALGTISLVDFVAKMKSFERRYYEAQTPERQRGYVAWLLASSKRYPGTTVIYPESEPPKMQQYYGVAEHCAKIKVEIVRDRRVLL